MSGESLAHAKLVEKLIVAVREKHRAARGLLILADQHEFGDDRPWSIDGFTPDVYASDVPVTFRIIGEAKTTDDLVTDRSWRQLNAFYRHLALYEGSTFYLAVPWRAAARAQAIVTALKKAIEGQTVQCEVLTFV